MARIAYSMAGEGRGHATRAKTIIDHLIKRRHLVAVFAPEFAYRFLSQVYQDEHRVDVKEIPGLMFHYRHQRLDFTKTALEGTQFLWRLPEMVRAIQTELERISIDLAITDFEPTLPRAAERSNIPWMSVDHQHFLVVSDFSDLPRHLRIKAWAMAKVVKRYYQNPLKSVVSSFYFPKLKPQHQGVVQTGVLLREQVVLAQPETAEHIVVYLRRYSNTRLLEVLSRSGCEVRIYGLGEQPNQGMLKFRKISEQGFLEDLRTCKALVSNAGNQLVGEALFLRKPVFVIPEDRNFEQELNARYLEKCGGGDWCYQDEITHEKLHSFLNSLEDFQCTIPRSKLNGNNATLQVIQSMLSVEVYQTEQIPTELVKA